MNFIITALSVYGLAKLLTEYDGLYGVFRRLREKYPNSALSCAVCTCVWLVVPMMLIAVFAGIVFVLPLAIIGIVILLEEITR